jgi:hypothetical protein
VYWHGVEVEVSAVWIELTLLAAVVLVLHAELAVIEDAAAVILTRLVSARFANTTGEVQLGCRGGRGKQ